MVMDKCVARTCDHRGTRKVDREYISAEQSDRRRGDVSTLIVVILTPVGGVKMTSQTICRKVKARKEYGDIVFPCEMSGAASPGARRPVDVGFAPTVAERRKSPARLGKASP